MRFRKRFLGNLLPELREACSRPTSISEMTIRDAIVEDIAQGRRARRTAGMTRSAQVS